MVYVVSKHRRTGDSKIFECQNKPDAETAIEENWAEYSPIAIFMGTRHDFMISYVDVATTKKKPKADISD